MSKTFARPDKVERVLDLRRGSRTQRFSPNKDRRVKGSRHHQRAILARLSQNGEY